MDTFEGEVATSKEPEMIKFALTARGLYLRLQFDLETLGLILILAHLCQLLM